MTLKVVGSELGHNIDSLLHDRTIDSHLSQVLDVHLDALEPLDQLRVHILFLVMVPASNCGTSATIDGASGVKLSTTSPVTFVVLDTLKFASTSEARPLA